MSIVRLRRVTRPSPRTSPEMSKCSSLVRPTTKMQMVQCGSSFKETWYTLRNCSSALTIVRTMSSFLEGSTLLMISMVAYVVTIVKNSPQHTYHRAKQRRKHMLQVRQEGLATKMITRSYSLACECAGVANQYGLGAHCDNWSRDGRPWCYVNSGLCPKSRRSQQIPGQHWAFCQVDGKVA